MMGDDPYSGDTNNVNQSLKIPDKMMSKIGGIQIFLGQDKQRWLETRCQ